jgi:transcription-repair coupling factor (superfamily II helicase)
MDNLTRLKRAVKQGVSHIRVAGARGSALAYLLSQVRTDIAHPCMVVLPSQEEASALYKDLDFFLATQNHQLTPEKNDLFLFPSYDISPLMGLSPPKELISRRIEALYSLCSGGEPVIVTSLDALMIRLLPKDILLSSVDYVAVNEEIDRDQLIENLVSFGYFRTSLVEERGDFSVRGGVIDLFPPLYESAVRLEFWGNTVESIRLFNPVDQRSSAELEELTVLPANEIILSHATIKRARSMGRLPGALQRGSSFPGQEAWLQHFYSHLDTIFEYLPSQAHVCLVESERIEGRAIEILKKLHEEMTRLRDEALGTGKPFPQTEGLYLGLDELLEAREGYSRIDFVDIDITTDVNKAGLAVDFGDSIRPGMAYDLKDASHQRASLGPLADKVKGWVEEGYQIVLICRTEQQARRLREILHNYNVQVRDILPQWSAIKRRTGLCICLGYLSHGFRFLDSGLIVITEDEIFGEKTGRERKTARDRVQAIPWTGFSQLKVGDLVVHQEHGIGRYEGLSKMEIESRVRDFMIIAYAHNDRLYIPADKVNIIQNYVGPDDDSPPLDALGGRSWSLAKRRAKRSIERIAKDLVRLYAMRKFLKGFAFSRPDTYYREFEAAFEYEETTDQGKAIDEVLTDMESESPMDRLICGDVGFGKTEVAMRASFKAVFDGKQVAILVPTTVLAEQHYQTFSRRFQSYPATIAVLSRFIPRSRQMRMLDDLRVGKIDIIIGTHRLLSDDVIFKDLGLLIIDEEQRFGVRAKEEIKKYRQFIDVLAMTATPIPRTLHMSLMGVRDLSIIQSPPADRLSIQTYVAKFDEDIIFHAIEREIQRGGQVFFVHNRVQTIDRMAERLRGLVPAATIDVAHGQMKERDLERAMLRFLAKETDVLVCTTIIDSGLDIPSANTIIINNVDRFGLAEIYQLRGRVGRSNMKAYAYLMISDRTTLTDDAQKRIKVLMDFSQLGSGVNIALHDLRIRGGGNILGFSQSGHIKAIGYELYLKLIEQALAALKGEVWKEEISPEIDTDLPVFIPHDYIEESDVRLDIYKRLSTIKEKKELEDVAKEIEDRFGPPPQEVLNLIAIIRIRTGLKRIGSTRLDIADGSMIFSFSKDTDLSPSQLVDVTINHPESFRFLSDKKLKIASNKKGSKAILKEAEDIIEQFVQYLKN